MITNSFFFPVFGRPFANAICMILVIIRMQVLPEKRKELSQTIVSLIGSLRTEKGCLRCDFCQSLENENELCILEEWDSRKNLNSHLKSERFQVFRGAMSLLQEPYEMIVHTVAAGKKNWKRGPIRQLSDRDDWGRDVRSVKTNFDRRIWIGLRTRPAGPDDPFLL
jgi:quinol monooxygenase YgiN